MKTKIYVYLNDEGTDCWRPVEAIHLGKGEYRIVSENTDPEDEHWQFATNDVVRCEEKQLAQGVHPTRCIVAVEKIEGK